MLGKPYSLSRLDAGSSRLTKTLIQSKRLSLPRVSRAPRGLPVDEGYGSSTSNTTSMEMYGFPSETSQGLLGIDADFGELAGQTVDTEVPVAADITEAVTQSAPAAAATIFPLDIGNIASTLDAGVTNVIQVLPEPLQGLLSTVAHDIIGLITFDISIAGGIRLVLLYYILFTRPSPISAILDYYLLGPVSRFVGPTFSENDFTLRDRLGNGNYGQGTLSYRLARIYVVIMIVCMISFNVVLQCMKAFERQRVAFLI